jgi:antitoxin HigA-1
VSKSSITTGKIPNTTPGEILLLEFIEPMDLSQNGLARAIGVPPRRINEIVLGKRSITADTDLRLARYFGVSEGSGLASRPTTTCCSGDGRLMPTWRGSRRIGGPHDWNVPDAMHRVLREHAAQHGCGAEADIRDFPERAVKPAKRVRLGDALAALGRKVGLTDEDVAIIDQMRDKLPAQPMKFD